MKQEKTFLEKSKDALNELSKEDAIYDEIQIGPQEEPIIHDFPINIHQYRKYVKKKNQKKSQNNNWLFFYSLLNASTGSFFEAIRAGIKPEIKVSKILNKTMIIAT